jgi:ADP-heptose:LPS heptosyltransferase
MAIVAPRIAVVALGRLADVLGARRVVDALRQRRGDAEIELVVADGTTQAAQLLPGVATRHTLGWEGSGLARTAPRDAVRRLRPALERIRGNGFDRVINMGTSSLSRMATPVLAGATATPEGLWTDPMGRPRASHPAAAHLDGWGHDPELAVFTAGDLLTIAARARLQGYLDVDLEAPRLPGIADDPAPRDRPIAIHLPALDDGERWRPLHGDQGWAGLVRALRDRLARPVVLVGAPGRRARLQRLALTTGAVLALLPMAETAGLLRRCAGLVTVDTIGAHVAAAVGCSAVVLADAAPGRTRTLPGAGSLVVHESTDATVEDVFWLAARHLVGLDLPPAWARTLAARLHIDEAYADEFGHLGARHPQWLPVSLAARDADDVEAAWRIAWRQSFDDLPVPSRIHAMLVHPGRDIDAERLAAAMRTQTRLARALAPRPHGRRAA